MSERFFSEPDTTDFESDESLRRVYGNDAVFQRVGAFTLVHLDTPSDELLAKREAEFDPDEYFFDDCPLCEHARASGGHIVFDAVDESDEDNEDVAVKDGESSSIDPEIPLEQAKSRPTQDFDRAMQQLSTCALAFDDAAKTRVPEWLADRIGFDVLILHDTILSTIWDNENNRTIEPIEQQIGRAFTTIAAARGEAPDLEDVARPLEAALKQLVKAWRRL